jgi:TPR repeat protein
MLGSLMHLLQLATRMSFEGKSLFESGLEDYSENRFEDALVKYHAAATMGHGGAMNAIATALWLGEGVEKDPAEAINWIKLSAENGDLRAMRNLALCFRRGVPDAGVVVDRTEAMRLMRMAANGGLVIAMCDLGEWLREANENDPVALEWYMKGAEAGSLYCMRRLGSLHRIGACGLQADNSNALLWYERAAATGDVDSIAILAVFLQEIGDLVRAVELYHKAADNGSATAMFNLAVCYENGTGVTKSGRKPSSCMSAQLSWATPARWLIWHHTTRMARA